MDTMWVEQGRAHFSLTMATVPLEQHVGVGCGFHNRTYRGSRGDAAHIMIGRTEVHIYTRQLRTGAVDTGRDCALQDVVNATARSSNAECYDEGRSRLCNVATR